LESKDDIKRRKTQPRIKKHLDENSVSKYFVADASKKVSRTEKLIVDFVVQGIHPYPIVDEPGFRSLLQGKK